MKDKLIIKPTTERGTYNYPRLWDSSKQDEWGHCRNYVGKVPFEACVYRKLSGHWNIHETCGYTILFIDGVPHFEAWIYHDDGDRENILIELPQDEAKANQMFNELYYNPEFEYIHL